MDRYPKKPCKFCGGKGHFPYQCFNNPKTKKIISTKGKYAKQWDVTKETWFRKNSPIQNPYPHYLCYICGKWLRPPAKYATIDTPSIEMVTLDHVLSKGRHPELRDALWDLKPCCWTCNTSKGSKDGEL
jgi:5-methylcytosine-specific restriction endonuclease McrA